MRVTNETSDQNFAGSYFIHCNGHSAVFELKIVSKDW